MAQAYEQVAPKPVGAAPAPPLPAAPAAAPAVDDSTVLLTRLNGVRLVPSANLLARGAPPAGQAVVVEGLPWLDPAKVEALSAGFLSRPLTKGDLSRLTRMLVLLCRKSDHPVVEVYVPPQDISSGVVQVVVLAARLGEVRVRGNRWFSDSLLTGQVRTKPGQEVTGETLMEDVDWLNQNPFRQVDLVYAKAQQPGETDAILRVADVRPERVYAGYDDSGTEQTGLGRAFAGFNLGNLWGEDNQLSYQYTRSTDGNLLSADSGSYTLPLPWRDSVSVFGSWARSNSLEENIFNLTGITWQAGLRYTVMLPVLPGYSQTLVFGADYKWTNNNLGFGGTQVFSSPSNIAQGVVTYSGTRSDDHGSTRGSLSAYYSPGGLGGLNHDRDFQVQRAGATADYGYLQAAFSRLERLPGDFTAALSGSGQWSSARLLATEQFGLGGEDSVRGYDERIVNGDDGVSAQLELRTPGRHLLGPIPDQCQALVFIDAGRDWQHDLQAGETENTLVSAGPGLRIQVGSHGTIKADYGWQLDRLAGTRSGRIHLSAILSF
jgi:hemolysin activation/secretion protein